MPRQKQTQVKQTADSSTVQELLNTDKFIANVRKHFGLSKEPRTVCKHCGNQLMQTQNGRCRICRNPAEGKTQEIWVEQENALMNKTGVEAFITTLRTNVDRNQIVSNFTTNEIRSIMIDFHEKWSMEIAREWENYGVKNRAQASKIVRDGTNVIWSLFKRAQGGDTMDAIAGFAQDVNKTLSEQKNEEKSNRLGLG